MADLEVERQPKARGPLSLDSSDNWLVWRVAAANNFHSPSFRRQQADAFSSAFALAKASACGREKSLFLFALIPLPPELPPHGKEEQRSQRGCKESFDYDQPL